MTVQRILVLGGGFAGLWSAIGSARRLDQLGIDPNQVEILLVNRDPYHNIRVRNYEADLSAVQVPLADVLEPIGVKWIEGEVVKIDWQAQSVQVQQAAGVVALTYDRLVFALGSQLYRPDLPGLAEFGFSVDTYPEAIKLNAHLQGLGDRPASPSNSTVLVVGAGLTGIEAAAEIPTKLQSVLEPSGQPLRVILADHNPLIGSDLGDSARPVIAEALKAMQIETRTGVSIVSIDAIGATLDTGEVIPAATVIWTAGMRANPLTQQFPLEGDSLRDGKADRWGRLPVNPFMQVVGVPNVFAAGDSAWLMIDGKSHASVMSCQHGRPMGRFAGYNVVSDLLGEPMLTLQIDWYVTVLDLGSWGAVYTEGWDRQVVATGQTAKQTKQIINCDRIYPPLTRDRQAILDAAAPVIQTPPKR
ncbi:MAG: FAD-dependent oxidoreductase [Aphanocapsa sp. GSE-SYN-MK-11-07L]|jgi:NADH dehydrogenase|nr:FAD-dependent oxidoreductase [Aphanocapsa sp. GSE-SYN-MK-11-07L]